MEECRIDCWQKTPEVGKAYHEKKVLLYVVLIGEAVHGCMEGRRRRRMTI